MPAIAEDEPRRLQEPGRSKGPSTLSPTIAMVAFPMVVAGVWRTLEGGDSPFRLTRFPRRLLQVIVAGSWPRDSDTARGNQDEAGHQSVRKCQHADSDRYRRTAGHNATGCRADCA